jgi:hypothetical protein
MVIHLSVFRMHETSTSVKLEAQIQALHRVYEWFPESDDGRSKSRITSSGPPAHNGFNLKRHFIGNNFKTFPRAGHPKPVSSAYHKM